MIPTPDPNGDTPTWTGFSGYYSQALGKTGADLRGMLTSIAANNHVRLSYAQVWTALEYADEDPANPANLILIYTGRSQDKLIRDNGTNNPNFWNREHVWPNSHGFGSESYWAYTDIHHLRPADKSVNSTRGDKDFDNGGTTDLNTSEGCDCLTDADSFQPRPVARGDVARMLFYMDLRYETSTVAFTGSTPDLQLVNTSTVGDKTGLLGKLCVLVEWARKDPVDAWEVRRHDRAVEKQKNRNPFIDNPAYVEKLYGSQCPAQ